MKHKLLTRTFTLGVIAAISLLPKAPAQAFIFSKGGLGVNITADDIGKDFWSEFNGQVDDQGITSTNVEGLTSRANFKVTDFTSSSIVFNILLENTSTGPITASVVSVLGFRSNPLVSSASVTSPSPAEQVDDFDIVVFNELITSFGGSDVNICFKEAGNRNNCNSGQGGVAYNIGQDGVAYNGSASFTATLNFNSDISSGLFLDEFGVRYQGINGTIDEDSVNGFSGTGVGEVPTPALIPGLIGMGIAALRKKKLEEDNA